MVLQVLLLLLLLLYHVIVLCYVLLFVFFSLSVYVFDRDNFLIASGIHSLRCGFFHLMLITQSPRVPPILAHRILFCFILLRTFSFAHSLYAPPLPRSPVFPPFLNCLSRCL